MRRERFTDKLVRMIKTIESGALPARVREFYVFGSYSRGALEPGDLDVVVIHDDPGHAYWQALQKKLEVSAIDPAPVRRFQSAMRGVLRKPGEKVQIILAHQLDYFIGEHSNIKREDLVLLWSGADHDYRPKLEAIRPDPTAGRAPRDHIIDLKRLQDLCSTMEHTVELLRNEELALTRIPIENIDCQLNEYHAHWLARCTDCMIMGKDSTKLLSYAMWWLEQHRQKSEVPDSLVIWSKSRTHRVHLGRPSLRWMLAQFKHSTKLKRQCLIPHIKARQLNELLIFERGKNWSSERVLAIRSSAD
jgi:hypothetical protein